MILPAPALVLSTDLDQARGWFWVLGFRVGCHRCGPKRPTRQSGAANHRHPHRRGATGGHSDGGVWIWTRQQCPPVARAWCSSVRVRQGDEGVPTGPCKASTERHDDTVRLRKNACSGAPSRVQQGPTQHRRLSKSNRPAEPPRRMILPALALVPSTDLDQARGWSCCWGSGLGHHRCGPKRPVRQSGAASHSPEVRRQRGTPMFLDRRPGWRDQAHQGRPGAHQCYRPASGGASERNEPQGRTCRMATMSSADTTNVSSSPITAPPAETQTATPVHQGQGGVREADDHRRRLIKAHPASTGVSRLHGHSAEINRAETASFVRPKTPHNPFPLRNLTPNLTLYKWWGVPPPPPPQRYKLLILLAL